MAEKKCVVMFANIIELYRHTYYYILTLMAGRPVNGRKENMKRKELLQRFTALNQEYGIIGECHRTSCSDCSHCINCVYCTGCNYLLCVNLKGKKDGYWLLNKEVSKAEWLEAKSALVDTCG